MVLGDCRIIMQGFGLKTFILVVFFGAYCGQVFGYHREYYEGDNDEDYFNTLVIIGVGLSGVIVDEETVLSFGLGKVDREEAYVYAGTREAAGHDRSHNFNDHRDKYKIDQTRKIQSIRVHPCFKDLEISLIKLDRPLIFNKWVKPAWFHSVAEVLNRGEPDNSNLPRTRGVIIGPQEHELRTKAEVALEFEFCNVEAKNYFDICAADPVVKLFRIGSPLIMNGFVAGLKYESTHFVDVTKLTCWISGEDSESCSHPDVGKTACGKDVNRGWWRKKDKRPEIVSVLDDDTKWEKYEDARRDRKRDYKDGSNFSPSLIPHHKALLTLTLTLLIWINLLNF